MAIWDIERPEGAIKHPKGNDKINYIIDFIMDMCDAPFSVYVTNLWPALLEGLITYYALDPIQIFTRWVKPPAIYKGFRGGNHGRGNRKRSGTRTWRRYWGSVTGFDPNNAIGDAIRVDDGWNDRSITPGVRTLWHLYDVEQRVMYWIMIYEITEDVFYKWGSGVANSMYCQAQYRPFIFCTSADDANLGVNPKTPIVIETVVKNRHAAFIGGNGIAAQGQGSAAIFRAKFVGGPGFPPIPPGCKLLIQHADGTSAESGEFGSIGQDQVVSASTPAAGLWQFYTVGPGNWQISDLEMTVIGNENIINEP